MKKKIEEINFQKIINAFVPYIWIIAVVSVALAALLGAYSAFLVKDTYTSTGKYMVVKVPYTDASSETAGLNTNEVEAMQSMIANVGEIINTYDFCDSVISQLGDTELTPKTLMSMMSIELCGIETTCYFLDVTSGDSELSYKVATIAGDLICEHFTEMGYAIKITEIDSPRAAVSADSKNVIRNSVIGFAIGFIICVLVVFVKVKLDIIITSRDMLESSFDYPILGTIPKLNGGHEGTGAKL